MTQTIKLYMNEETLVTLVDHFENEKDKTLRKFCFENLLQQAKQASMADLNKSFTGYVVKDGKLTQDLFQTTDYDLSKYELPSDPNWKPKNLTPDDTEVFEFKIGDKTYDQLVNYGRIYSIRVENYNNSIPIIQVQENGKTVEKSDPKFKKDDVPSCFEEIIYNSLINPIQALLGKIVQDVFQKEFDEIEQQEKVEKQVLTN